jgi:hypothetical protein
MTLRLPVVQFIALACLLAALPVAAKRDETVQLNLGPATTATEFAIQRQQIETAIKHPEHYVEMRAEDRRVVSDALERMGGQLESAGSVAALDESTRKALLAEQDDLNRRLEQAHYDSRVVCAREKVIGSSMRRNVCLTVAQRRRAADEGRGMVRPEG